MKLTINKIKQLVKLQKLTKKIKSKTSIVSKNILPVGLKTLSVSVKVFLLFLPSLLVISALTSPQVEINLQRGQTLPTSSDQEKQMIDDLFPNSGWNDLEPCGLHFNEQEEFNKALQCVTDKVWDKGPITDPNLTIPRCFILKAKSPDVYTRPDIGFNFIPIMEFDPQSGTVISGAVVGYYQTETKTVFVVENIDAPMVYRHELQHYFLHIQQPITGGGGHHQKIWDRCEPPYYTPSDKVRARREDSHEIEMEYAPNPW